ncbi:MAG: holo-ACP synthase [Thermodesulfobacteriota bacterium]
MAPLSSGIDIVSISRIRRLSGNESFLDRVFTTNERACASARRRPWRHLAGRFAAKEAVMKALGAGWGQGASWKEIEVVTDGGRPRVKLHRVTEALLKGRRISLSISYADEFAAAFAVVE